MNEKLRLLRRVLVAFACPQRCILCTRWVVNPDASPLCEPCLKEVSPLLPPLCWSCGIPIPGNVTARFGICSVCREHAFDFDCARAWGLYAGGLRKVIWSFKYRGLKRLVVPLAQLLENTFLQYYSDDSVDRLIPVPLHTKRVRARGFDQTLLLARHLSERISIPVLCCIKRSRHTDPQFGFSGKARLRNVRDAFTLSGAECLKDEDVLIIDDVMTTGATVQEVSGLLRRETDVRTIGVLTVARVPKISTWR